MRLSAFCLLSILLSCQGETPEQENLPPVEVTATQVVPQTIPIVFEYIAVVESSHLVEIRARVEGYLEKIGYQEGEVVKTGDLLFQIDSKPFVAALDNAKATLEKQEAILWNAKRTKERLEPLFEKNAVSRRDLDNAIANELSAEAEVQSAKASVRTAELNLGYTTIVSPVTGLASRSTYQEGALIMPGSSGLLTKVSVVNPIWVNFNISLSDILKSRQELADKQLIYPKDYNFTVTLTLADGSVFPQLGKVNFAEPSLQPTTGTMLIRAEFPNPDNILLPGEFVRVHVWGAIRPNAIIVPQQAVQQGQQGMYVYVVDKENKAAMRLVTVGDWYKTDWIIKSGLEKGDTVIVEGVNKAQPGMQVKITKTIPNKTEKLASMPSLQDSSFVAI